MSAGGGPTEVTAARGTATALDVFRQTVVTDMHRKFAGAPEACPSAAAWREELAPQVCGKGSTRPTRA